MDPQPRLIVVCGLGGSGKTTLADALSRELRVACLHKDTIKAAVLDRLGVVTSASFDLFVALVEEQLANGVDLIAEATFHGASDIELLRGWQARYGVDLVCVVCEAGLEARRHRLTTRARHAAHAEADRAQIDRLGRESVDYAAIPGRVVRVDTERPLAACVAEIVTELA